MGDIKKGSNVKWKWGKVTGHGKVVETFDKKVIKKIKGKEVTRNASKKNKAILVKNENDDKSLHLEKRIKKDDR